MAKLEFDIRANDGVSKVIDKIQSRYLELEKAAKKAGVSVSDSLSSNMSSFTEVGGSLDAQIKTIQNYYAQLGSLSARRKAILSKGSGASASERSELLKINKAYNDITQSIKEEEAALRGLATEFQNSMGKCEKELDDFDKQLGKSAKEGGAGKLKSSLASIGKMAAGVFTVRKAAEFAKKVTQVRGEMQALNAAFTTMLGSKEASDALIQEGIEFAATTPFDLQQVAKGMKQLLAFGTQQENVINDMRMLGDVAAGLTIPIGDLIYLYGTLRAQGRVMTIDIRQFAMRGIPIYDELARVLGVAKSQIQEMISSGQVTFEHVEQAFKNMTSEGGKFAGLTQGIAGTIQGRISNLGDAIYQMFNQIGQKTEGIINTVLSVASIAVENYEKIGKVLGDIILFYGSYRAALIAQAAVNAVCTRQAIANAVAEGVAVEGVTAAYARKQKVMNILNKTILKNPYALLAATLTTLTFKAISYNMAIASNKDAQEAYNKRLEKQNKLMEENKKRAQEQLSIIGGMTVGSEERNKAIEKLTQEYPELLNLYDLEIIKLMDIKQLSEDIENIQKDRLIKADFARLDELRNQLGALRSVEADFKAAGDYGVAFQEVQKKIKRAEYEIAALEKKYGGSLEYGPPRPSGSSEEEVEVKNKEYWEKKKKAAESAYEALAADQLATAEALKLEKEIAEAERELEKYDRKKTTKTTKDDVAKAEEKLTEAILEQKNKRALEGKKGDKKELEEMRQAHEKRVAELKKEKAELEKIYKKNGGLNDTRRANLAMYDGLIASENQSYGADVDKYKRDMWEELVDRYDFNDKLSDINKKYQDEIDLIYANSEDIEQQRIMLKALEGAYKEDLASLYETVQTEGAKIKQEFTNILGGPKMSEEEWVDSFKDKSLQDLESELNGLNNILLTLGRIGKLSAEDAASLMKMIELLSKAIDNNKKEVEEGNSSWAELSLVLNNVGQAFQQAGDKIGGTAGRLIGLIGGLATNAAKVGVALEDLESEDTAERMTAGLDIVSMSVNGLATLISLSNAEMERSLELTRMAWEYQRSIEQLQAEKERGLFSNAFGTDSYGQFLHDFDVVQEKAYRSAVLMEEIFGKMGVFGINYTSLWESLWGNQEGTLTADMRTDWGKFWGSNSNIVTKDWADFFSNGEFQGDELREWFEIYKDGLDEVTRAYIEGVLNEWDTYQEALENIGSYLSSLFGDITGNLANDMLNQFLETGSAILDMSSYMDDFSKNIAKSIIQSMLLSKVFTEEMQDEIAAMIASGDTEGAINAYNNLLSSANDLAPEIQAFLEGIGLNLDQAAQEATAGGFQTMSQDTGEELNGRFTAVQISSEATRAAVEELTYNFSLFLQLYGARGVMVDDIRNIQAQSLLELRAINENTSMVIKPIKEMNATMTEMNEKIKTL